MNNNKAKFLSNQLYLELEEKEIREIIEEFSFFDQQMKLIKQIDVKNYSPISFPLDSFSEEYKKWNINNLRDDVPEKSTNETIFLIKNCSEMKDDFVKIKKVI